MSSACNLLHRLILKQPRFKAGFDPSGIPSNGIYFLFEDGEQAHGSERIVRVGTHTGQNNLPKRIREHLYTPNKDRSIFRKHVGRCLLRRANSPFAKQWEIDLTQKASREKYSNAIDLATQADVEREVSDYMTKHFSFSVIRIDNKQDRMIFEERLIGTICRCDDCHASPGWLGNSHPDQRVTSSGIWNIQGQTGDALSEEEVIQLFKNS